MPLYPSTDFFDLEHYLHKGLFEGLQNVWEALDRIGDYLSTIPMTKDLERVSDQAYLVNPESIIIEAGVSIEPGAYVKGPCYFGAGTSVRHGAYIRGNVVTGRDCVIGHCTEVKNTIFLNKAQAAHFAYLGDSILGNRVNLGAGTRCANLRLDGKNIKSGRSKERVSTGRRKLGAVVGDEAQLGCNCVTNPGTLIERQAKVLPCANVGGWVCA